MKLKRILSLALSGVLAVSMLTACGGSGILSGNRSIRETTAVVSAMNTELATLEETTVTVTYKSDSDLRKAVSNVADTVTVVEAAQADKDGALAPDSILNMAKRYVEITNNASFSKHTNPSDGAIWGTVVLFDGDMSAVEVGKAMAANANEWELKALADEYTFDGNVEAYKVTIPAADSESDDVAVWVVGITLAETAKSTEGK